MDKKIYTTIVGSGSYIPPKVIPNSFFLDWEFYDPTSRTKFETPNEDIIRKFKEITNIEERRYAEDEHVTSDLAAFAAKDAIASSGIDPESFDFIVLAHNFGDMPLSNHRTHVMPALANRVKNLLGIKNPACIAHDLIAGCPGWVTAMIVADSYIKSGTYKRGLVIGSDINSRVRDPHDRDSMIFADGAGAVIVEGVESETPVGILAHSSRSDCDDSRDMLSMGGSLNPEYKGDETFIRMKGNKVYVYALGNVAGVVKDSLDKAGLHLDDVNKVLIHQANEKMDEAILSRVFRLYGKRTYDKSVMPMTINQLGNSSAATIPTLYDLIMKKKMDEHKLHGDDVVIFTSVGAGLNINSIVYRMP